MIEGITGQKWNPENNWYGAMRTSSDAEALKNEQQRLDLLVLPERPTWYEHEKDESRGGALPEHLDAAIKSGKVK